MSGFQKKGSSRCAWAPIALSSRALNQKVELQYSKIELVAIVWAYKNFRID